MGQRHSSCWRFIFTKKAKLRSQFSKERDGFNTEIKRLQDLIKVEHDLREVDEHRHNANIDQVINQLNRFERDHYKKRVALQKKIIKEFSSETLTSRSDSEKKIIFANSTIDPAAIENKIRDGLETKNDEEYSLVPSIENYIQHSSDGNDLLEKEKLKKKLTRHKWFFRSSYKPKR